MCYTVVCAMVPFLTKLLFLLFWGYLNISFVGSGLMWTVGMPEIVALIVCNC